MSYTTFRAYSHTLGEWLDAKDIYINGNGQMIGDTGKDWADIPEDGGIEIERSTNMVDQNGKAVFAGDIVEVVDGVGGLGTRWLIIDDGFRFLVRKVTVNGLKSTYPIEHKHYFEKYFRVVGNKLDNKDLIKE